MTTIKICLGSSCFARGNAEVLSFLKNYISAENKHAKLELVGCRCGHLCGDGPNVFIDGQKYTKVTPQSLQAILEKL
ncbi:MAG: (2Fe-2S) ferredoxin domain-containing protein [Alphaproteobacteria bacterium]|nr:(2Fe-2S) ferredoxin domain-containing protein [Alphaproteobacteria bacterium]